jgi:hypothetical protein
MSIIGILASNFFSAGSAQHTANAGQCSQNGLSRFEQIKAEFQQLGQDLQSGNLTQAQSDFAALSQNLPGATQSIATNTSTTPGTSTLAQAFNTLAQDLQTRNLSGAQSAFATLQNDLQQIGGFLPGGSSGSTNSVTPVSTGNLNVSA